MARFSRIAVAQEMARTGMVPVFNHPDFETAWNVISACYRGGVRVFEFTNRGDFAHEVFAQVVKRAATELPDLILGAGTVFDAGTAALYIQSGANFIVSPVVKEDMALTCNRRKILWSPGCATLTEISRAEELGAEIVKVFPGEVLGPAFVKGALAPMPWTRIMPTGGVEPTRESLKSWFDAGVVCVGMGSKLFPKEVIEARDFAAIETRCAQALALITEVRPKPRAL